MVVVGVVRRGMARGAVRLAEKQFLAAHLRLASPSPDRVCRSIPSFGAGREVQQLLELGHEMDLAATVEDVHALLAGDHGVAIEVRGALLELGEVLDGLQRALRAEESLHVHAAEARRVDAAAQLLRADVADEVRRARWCGRWRGSRSR